MSNCWIVYLIPFAPEDRNKPIVAEFQKGCIKDGIFGMGWSIGDTNDFDDIDKITYDDYNIKWKEYLNDNNAEVNKTAFNNYIKIEKGDIVIIRNKDSHYYIGKVSQTAKYHSYIEMKKTDYYNDYFNNDYFNLEENNVEKSPLSFYCRVEKWIDIEEEYGAVPSIIVGRFSQRMHQTITRVADEMLKNIMENLISSDKVKIAINIDNFTDVLYADELEDLVGFYMEANNTNYHFLPSSCKNSTQKYEFIMINDDCKQITCQAKNKKIINLDDYMDDKNIYEKIYIFSAEGVSGKASKNIEVISREALYKFLKDYPSCSFFRKRLEKWYTFE